jgi:small-conductance mechanosensitive channel
MEVHINLYAVLLGGLASMVIGMIYYADPLFGKLWKKLAKIDKKRFEKEMLRVMPGVFIAALITAYVVAYMTFLYQAFFQTSWIEAGLVTSLILWLGLSVTTTYVHNSLDQRPSQLTAISMGNRLLSILAMGALIGWLHP